MKNGAKAARPPDVAEVGIPGASSVRASSPSVGGSDRPRVPQVAATKGMTLMAA